MNPIPDDRFLECTYKEVKPNIWIRSDAKTPPDFHKFITDNLNILESKDIGKRLISKIGLVDTMVTIEYSEKTPFNCCTCEAKVDPQTGKSQFATIIITENPHDYIGFSGERIQNKPFLSLANRLIEAYHYAVGKNYTNVEIDKKIWTDGEIYHTIMGYPSKKNTRTKPKVTENSIRAEHGIPLRFSHYSYQAAKNRGLIDIIKSAGEAHLMKNGLAKI